MLSCSSFAHTNSQKSATKGSSWVGCLESDLFHSKQQPNGLKEKDLYHQTSIIVCVCDPEGYNHPSLLLLPAFSKQLWSQRSLSTVMQGSRCLKNGKPKGQGPHPLRCPGVLFFQCKTMGHKKLRPTGSSDKSWLIGVRTTTAVKLFRSTV